MISKVLPVRQYYPQTDSKTSHSSRMCFSSTCAMGLKYLLPDALKGSNADDDYLKRVFCFGDTIDAQAHIKALATYGVSATFSKRGTKSFLISEIDKGYPVAAGFLHHGHVSAPRGGGHWVLVIGYTDTHVICHDPYGELDNVNGGYVKIGSGGKQVSYTWKNWLPRWEADDPGSGWYLTFRAFTPAPVTYANDWTGVYKAAITAGAKFPEVVAAQWAMESGWGKFTSGKNNYFGIKGKGTIAQTKEFIGGKEVTIRDEFKDFNSLYECVLWLVDRWYKDLGAYRGVNRARSVQECCQLLVDEGYATDPNYAQKLLGIIRQKNDPS